MDSPVALDSPSAIEGGRAGISIAGAADLNTDGFADILVSGAETFLFTGNPARELTHVQVDAAGVAVELASDVDGDGIGDVMLTHPLDEAMSADAQGSVRVYESGGTALSFDEPTLLYNSDPRPGGYWGVGVGEMGDLDGDGLAEAYVAYALGANESGVWEAATYALTPSEVGARRASQVGPAPSGSYYSVLVAPTASVGVIALGDTNGSGYPDLGLSIVTNQSGGGYRSAGALFIYEGADIDAAAPRWRLGAPSFGPSEVPDNRSFAFAVARGR